MLRIVTVVLATAVLATLAFSTTALAARPKCDGLRATIVGTNGADVIRGTNKRDVIVAKGGADVIRGRGGKDVICGGGGRDTVYGGGGNDRILGGAQRDKLYGGTGKDRLFGQRGWDRLVGNGGNDVCFGGADGAQVVACERPDIRVGIRDGMPALVAEDTEFTWYYFVENAGPSTATFTLEIKNSFRDVTCTPDIQDKVEVVLPPGQDGLGVRAQQCAITGPQPAVRLQVVAVGDFPDVRPGNDRDAHVVSIFRVL